MEPGDKKASKSVVMSIPIPAVSATARSARNPTLANSKDTGTLFIGQDEFSEQFISADYLSRRAATPGVAGMDSLRRRALRIPPCGVQRVIEETLHCRRQRRPGTREQCDTPRHDGLA